MQALEDEYYDPGSLENGENAAAAAAYMSDAWQEHRTEQVCLSISNASSSTIPLIQQTFTELSRLQARQSVSPIGCTGQCFGGRARLAR